MIPCWLQELIRLCPNSASELQWCKYAVFLLLTSVLTKPKAEAKPGLITSVGRFCSGFRLSLQRIGVINITTTGFNIISTADTADTANLYSSPLVASDQFIIFSLICASCVSFSNSRFWHFSSICAITISTGPKLQHSPISLSLSVLQGILLLRVASSWCSVSAYAISNRSSKLSVNCTNRYLLLLLYYTCNIWVGWATSKY